MKYWLLTTEYPPFHGGGISTYCKFTSEMLAGEGTGVTVFVPDDSIADHTVVREQENITLVRFNSNRNKWHQSLGYTARLSYEMAAIVMEKIREWGRPDHIEAQDYLGIGYYLQQFRLLGHEDLANIPITITLHSPAFLYLEYNRVPTYRFPDFHTTEMEKYSIRSADLLISPTAFLAGEIGRRMDLFGQRLEILPNPYRDEVIEEQPIPAFQRGKVIYYGKLSPQKGSFELLEFFKDLWEEGFMVPLYLVGGTDIVYHPEMLTMGQIIQQKYARYIQSGLLQFQGKIAPSSIRSSLAAAHVILVPSIVDNLPYVVMEAMSLGKIVLASVQGGQREMIEDGENGFLFDHQQPSSFKERLLRILEMTDEAVIEMGQKARQRVKTVYDFQSILARKKALLPSGTLPRSDIYPFLHQEKRTVEAAITIPPDDASLLSVVIPYYNLGPLVMESIESVLHSTYHPLEILVIDDGSTDPLSLRQLEQLEGHEKVRVIRQKNKGLAETRNEGARMARGGYLAFLDADDKVAPEYYSKAIKALRSYKNVYFAGCWVRYFENSNACWPTFNPAPPYALVHNPVNSSALVYKREAFLAGGLNDRQVGYGLEDYESVISMLSKGLNGIVLPEILFFYRVRTGSMFRNVSREKLLYSNKYIAEKHADYYAKFASQVINLLNANGPGYLYDNPTFEVRVTSKTTKTNALLTKAKSFIKRNERLKKIAILIKKTKS